MDHTIDDDSTIMSDPDPISNQTKNAFVQIREELLEHLSENSNLATLVTKFPMPDTEEEVVGITTSFEKILVEEGISPALKTILHILELGENFTIMGQKELEKEGRKMMELIQTKLDAVKSSRERAEGAKWVELVQDWQKSRKEKCLKRVRQRGSETSEASPES